MKRKSKEQAGMKGIGDFSKSYAGWTDGVKKASNIFARSLELRVTMVKCNVREKQRVFITGTICLLYLFLNYKRTHFQS